jgi:hypothetical protein
VNFTCTPSSDRTAPSAAAPSAREELPTAVAWAEAQQKAVTGDIFMKNNMSFSELLENTR